MKYIGENAITKLISLIKGDLATKQDSIAATGVLERDTTGVINGVETVGATLVETQEATLVDVPNGLLKGDGTTISAAVAGTDYVNSNQAIRYDAAQILTNAQKTQARSNIAAAPSGGGVMERTIDVHAESASESYDTFCAKLDAVLATMPTRSVKFLCVYPPQYYGFGTDICALYKLENDYASVYTIGSYNYGRQGFRMIKRKHYSSDPAGQWYPLEYINPEMRLGVEYRTTERYLGKPVYVKAVNFGAGPSSAMKTVAHGVENIDKAIRVWGNIDNYNLIGFSGVSSVFVGVSEIAINTSENLSARNIVVGMAYTKTTD